MEPIRTGFDRELAALKAEVGELGRVVDQAIARSVRALERGDVADARRIIAEDQLVNQRRYSIEERALLALATQQPVASDLRAIAAAIHLAGELERMGDHAKGNAEAALVLASVEPHGELLDIPRLGESLGQLLRQALSAFEQSDAGAAAETAASQAALDERFNGLYHRLIEQMIADPGTIRWNTVLLTVAHNLERIADRVTNVCERVAFAATGRLEEWDRETDGIRRES